MILADFRYDKADKRKKLPHWIQQVLPASHRNLAVDLAVQVARRFLQEMARPPTLLSLGSLRGNTPVNQTAASMMRCVRHSPATAPQ
jgi:hypothetical protein